MRRRTSGTASTPIGTLIQKIHCQANPSVTAPPTIGPPRTARPVRLLNTPIAQPRRSGGKAAPSRLIDSGITTAAPTPCKARAPISHGTVGASAQAIEATVNRASPPAKVRLRPQRSPRAAALSMSTAKVSA
jgi:hypothetical protein